MADVFEVLTAGFEHLEFEERAVWPLLRQAISPAWAVGLGTEIATRTGDPSDH